MSWSLGLEVNLGALKLGWAGTRIMAGVSPFSSEFMQMQGMTGYW